MRLRRNFAMVAVASAGMLALVGCGGSSLAQDCDVYYDFDQEYSAQIQEAMTVSMGPDASEEELAETQELAQNATSDFQTVVAEASDDEFIATAEQTLPSFELIETLADPEVADAEKMQLAQSPELQEAVEAESQLIEMCNAELN